MKLDAATRAAIGVLWRRFGLFRALLIGLAVEREKGRGKPFGHLDPATDDAERLSREQIGPAIVLFGVLARRYDDRTAIEVTTEVVEKAAHAFLAETIGPLDRETLGALDAEARDAFVRDRMARFPNATVRFDHIGSDEVRFTVTSCRFVRLCREAGSPELAPLFCAGDATFFGGVEPDVVLIRETTIAHGGPNCPFILRYAEREPAAE